MSARQWVASASRSTAFARVAMSPARARAPSAAVIAAGVASERAQGQVTTRTETSTGIIRDGSWSSHPTATPVASTSTPPMNHAAARSASSAMAGRSRAACSARRSTPPRTVSSPVETTSASTTPEPLTLPASTRSPAERATGFDSPVSRDSSNAECPERMVPSAGTTSPGRTRTRSPGRSAAAGIRSVPGSSRLLPSPVVSPASPALAALPSSPVLPSSRCCQRARCRHRRWRRQRHRYCHRPRRCDVPGVAIVPGAAVASRVALGR